MHIRRRVFSNRKQPELILVLWLCCIVVLQGFFHIVISSSSLTLSTSHSQFLNNNLCLWQLGYSKIEEDNALLKTLQCMGGNGTKEYFELGGTTTFSPTNTRALKDLHGWRGHFLNEGIDDPKKFLHAEYVTPANIVSLLQKYHVSKSLDVLSVDAEYDDFYVTREILLAGYQPRVLITEFNPYFGLKSSALIATRPLENDRKGTNNKNCYFGASAMATTHLVQAFGYTPVFSNNINALFFVRLDQAIKLGMRIPSMDTFADVKTGSLDKSCLSHTWKAIKIDTIKEIATTNVDHVQFAASLPDTKLRLKEYLTIMKVEDNDEFKNFLGAVFRNLKLTAEQYIDEQYGFHPSWHPLTRSERFPSITQRLKLYMGNWYLPPCNDKSSFGLETIDEKISYFYNYTNNSIFPTAVMTRSSLSNDAQKGEEIQISTKNVRHDRVFAISENNLKENCLSMITGMYCSDAKELAKLALQLKAKDGISNLSQLPPLLAMFGDNSAENRNVPSFQKTRHSSTRDSLEYITSKDSGLNCTKREKDSENSFNATRKFLTLRNGTSVNTGIIWPFHYSYHFGSEQFDKVRKYDIPWENKKNKAVWRGTPTGYWEDNYSEFNKFCESLPRCRLAQNYFNSSILDVGLKNFGPFKRQYKIPNHLFKPEMSMEAQFKYKAIIVIEGNDVATGLKWALYSRSVVLMPIPERMSYAMEEWLEPWVHYVPINMRRDEAGLVPDVEEKLQWVLDNDEEARKIAERATLFIHDLLFDSEYSEKESTMVKEMIMERYFNFFK